MARRGASLDRLEGDALELAGWLVLITLALIIYLAYRAGSGFSLPVSLYPQTIWGAIADAIDGGFYAVPSGLKSISDPLQKTIDPFLGAVYQWLGQNLGNPANARGWNDYANQFQGTSASTATGTDFGGNSDPAAYEQFAAPQLSLPAPAMFGLEGLPGLGSGPDLSAFSATSPTVVLDPYAGLPPVDLPRMTPDN
jgi:hypothetical protein